MKSLLKASFVVALLGLLTALNASLNAQNAKPPQEFKLVSPNGKYEVRLYANNKGAGVVVSDNATKNFASVVVADGTPTVTITHSTRRRNRIRR